MEPYTCVPNAIQLQAKGVDTGLQILQPGESFATTIRIAVMRLDGRIIFDFVFASAADLAGSFLSASSSPPGSFPAAISSA